MTCFVRNERYDDVSGICGGLSSAGLEKADGYVKSYDQEEQEED